MQRYPRVWINFFQKKAQLIKHGGAGKTSSPPPHASLSHADERDDKRRDAKFCVSTRPHPRLPLAEGFCDRGGAILIASGSSFPSLRILHSAGALTFRKKPGAVPASNTAVFRRRECGFLGAVRAKQSPPVPSWRSLRPRAGPRNDRMGRARRASARHDAWGDKALPQNFDPHSVSAAP